LTKNEDQDSAGQGSDRRQTQIATKEIPSRRIRKSIAEKIQKFQQEVEEFNEKIKAYYAQYRFPW